MGCCTCSVAAVSLASLLLTLPLLAPSLLSTIRLDSYTVSNTSASNTSTTTIMEVDTNLLRTGLGWLYAIPASSLEEEVIDEVTKQELDLFITGLIDNVEQSSVVTLTIAALNLATNLTLLVGSCCRLSCLLLPWLVVSMVEVVVLAVPATIFCSLLGLYLYCKGILVASVVVVAVPASLLLVSLVTWLTVLAAYLRSPRKQEEQGYPVWPRLH